MSRVRDDEPDLYPPDVEHVTPELRNQRNRAIAGTALVTFGCGLLLDIMFGADLDYFWLAIGLGLLAGWAQARRFPLFAAGSIMTGFALGSFFESAVHLRFESTLGYLLGAAGFFAVYVRYPKAGRWAVIPAAIFGVIAVADFGFGLLGLVPKGVNGVLLPMTLVTAGSLLLFRHSLPRSIVKGGLIATVIVFVSAGASSVDTFGANGLGFGGREDEIPMPDIGDRTVVISTYSGDVRVETAVGPPVVTIRTHGHRNRNIGSVAKVTGTQVQLFSPSSDYHAILPPGTPLVLHTISGDVEATVADAGDIEIGSTSGDVEIGIVPAPETSSPSSADTSIPKLAVQTVSGDVDVDYHKAERKPAVALNSLSGDVSVNDDDRDHNYTREGPGRKISVDTTSGDIELVGV